MKNLYLINFVGRSSILRFMLRFMFFLTKISKIRLECNEVISATVVLGVEFDNQQCFNLIKIVPVVVTGNKGYVHGDVLIPLIHIWNGRGIL